MNTELDSVLVVGGCGFLGHHIVSQIVQSSPSSKISVLDLRTNHNRIQGVSYYDGDITSATAVNTILEAAKPTVIIHTASPVVSKSNVNIYEKVNVNGTRNLLECAGKVGVKAFVYTSSASVVHDSVSDLVDADESLPVLRTPQQTEIYSHTKGVADDLVLAANRKYGGMLTVSIRPAGIFGEGDVQMIPNMLKVYYDGKTKFQLGDNKNVFDFTYVGNVAHAHILAAKKLLAESVRSGTPANKRIEGEAFFVTNDEPVHFWDFTRAVWRAAGDTSDPKRAIVVPKAVGLVVATLVEWIVWIIFFGTREPSLTRQKIKFSCMTRTYRIDKIKKKLGYEAQVTMDEGIKKSVQWFQKEKSHEKKEK
ncbi:erg26, C-3 sterol dehydrogenase [Varicellaria rhodocarpa]|nr:erg26, C-3 sterol dehydrogenase [Varicellaria rhodocarpa]